MTIAKHSRNRPEQVRRAFTSRGIPGVESRGTAILGVPGWQFVVTTQEGQRAHGMTLWDRLANLNGVRRSGIIRARASTIPGRRIELEDAAAIIRFGDLLDLIEFRYNHERGSDV